MKPEEVKWKCNRVFWIGSQGGYNVFAQDTYTPVVTAATLRLAYDIINHITSTNKESG